MVSKSKIDKSGRALSQKNGVYNEETLELELIFDQYRKEHLEPLTRLTLELQQWLQSKGGNYYIAQRLKRKPQILRKLNRFSVRLTQLQDIGGCRIIVEDNDSVNNLFEYLKEKLSVSDFADVVRITDYRERGRDDTGYRALHIIMMVSGRMLELQIRSQIQHYWSESIERTSVVYGYRLKEKEGDKKIIQYFKEFSNLLHDIESGRKISPDQEIILQELREESEKIIEGSYFWRGLSGYINQDVIKTMIEIEKGNRGQINNWILVFDWSDGCFITWEMVGRDPEKATTEYLRYESEFTEDDRMEVVMIGTSSIETVMKTHSHYFGISQHNLALEGMQSSIIGLSKRSKIDVGARRILMTLINRSFWGVKKVKISTLKNHFCGNIATFDHSLLELRKLDIIDGVDPISIDVKKKSIVDQLIG